MCYAWAAEMLNAPDFGAYGENTYTWTAYDYWMEEYLGGNSVLKEFYIGGYEYELDSPLKDKAYEYKDTLMESWNAGTKTGGFFTVKQIAKAPPVEGDTYGTFYDVWLLTEPVSSTAHNKML